MHHQENKVWSCELLECNLFEMPSHYAPHRYIFRADEEEQLSLQLYLRCTVRPKRNPCPGIALQQESVYLTIRDHTCEENPEVVEQRI